MSVSIRPARPADLTAVTDLLVENAVRRARLDPVVWRMASHARERIATAVTSALEAENPPFQQQWRVAESGGVVVGVSHAILLPVPPIYAGAQGMPGLIMEDSHVSGVAPSETHAALLDAAEAALTAAGARILLASSAPGGPLIPALEARGYAPLTLYLGKSGLRDTMPGAPVRPAAEEDVPGIVAQSAANRRLLDRLDPFWQPHADADRRFDAWMRRSLTLSDRDMFVAAGPQGIEGYAISQPVTLLHLPPAHDISATGIIDDFYAHTLAEADRPEAAARDLLHAAEAARTARGDAAVLVVCPAAWTAKRALLEAEGFATAITWYIRR